MFGGLGIFAAVNKDEIMQRQVNQVYDQVSDDFTARYQIAARNGTAMDRCAQAGLVAAAMLQAKNEPGYAQWKKTEEKDCAEALEQQ